uniref:Uncharacterized protein n=1 Tax=Araucaria cunninghamii TaxID=56994 RepID=A0A0D6R3M3_ARACU
MLGTGSGSSLNFMQTWAEEIKKGRRRRQGPGKVSCSAGGFLKMRARSASPPRSPVSYDWEEFSRVYDEEETSGAAGAKKRRDSWGWCLREFLYRSISEGRGRAREKERESVVFATPLAATAAFSSPVGSEKKNAVSKRGQAASNGGGWLGKKRSSAPVPTTPNNNKAGRKGHVVSAHERYYPVERARAQAEDMKRKTFLPYKQAVLGCLGPSFADQQNPSVLLSPSAI